MWQDDLVGPQITGVLNVPNTNTPAWGLKCLSPNFSQPAAAITTHTPVGSNENPRKSICRLSNVQQTLLPMLSTSQVIKLVQSCLRLSVITTIKTQAGASLNPASPLSIASQHHPWTDTFCAPFTFWDMRSAQVLGGWCHWWASLQDTCTPKMCKSIAAVLSPSDLEMSQMLASVIAISHKTMCTVTVKLIIYHMLLERRCITSRNFGWVCSIVGCQTRQKAVCNWYEQWCHQIWNSPTSGVSYLQSWKP